MKEEWIKQIQEKMADYKESAPEVSWNEIAKALSDQKQQAKVVPLWLRNIAAAVLLLVIAMVGYKVLENDTLVSEKLTDTEQSQQMSSFRQTETLSQDNPTEKPLFAKAKQAARQTIQPESVIEAKSEIVNNDSMVKAVASQPMPEQTHEVHTERKQTHIYYPAEPHQSPAYRNRLTAKLYMSNTMGNCYSLTTSNRMVEIKNNGEKPNKPINSDIPVDVFSESDGESGINNSEDNNGEDNNGDGDKQTRSNNPLGKTSNTTTKTITTNQNVHHYQPVHYGLSLRYRLNERWGIETGLTYSLLNSDITTTEEGKTTESKQQLNYIGIPLKADYLLWKSRHFNVYISAGTMVEKMVKGSLETVGKNTKENISIHSLQLSVNSGIGAEYQYNSLLSIYVEPGIGYYFDNGSSISTFYQENPLNFNLNVGLRFQINGKGQR